MATKMARYIVAVLLLATLSLACVPSPSSFPGKSISSLGCSGITRTPPYSLPFDGGLKGVPDAQGKSTGFTMYLPGTQAGTGYFNPSLLTQANGVLSVKTSNGDAAGSLSNAVNMLGVGLGAMPDNSLQIDVTFRVPTTAGTNACSYFAVSQADFVRLCVTTGGGTAATLNLRQDGNNKPVRTFKKSITLRPSRILRMRLILLPKTNTVELFYSNNQSGPLIALNTLAAPNQFFNHDAAGIDFQVRSRSFAGIHCFKLGTGAPAVVRVLHFTVAFGPKTGGGDGGGGGDAGDVNFTTFIVPGIENPTALAWGPGQKLYATTAEGTLQVFTFNTAGTAVVSQSSTKPVGSKLVLGVAVQPGSTATSTTLYLCYSDVAQEGGTANSGAVSRVSGAGFRTVKTILSGLPRAYANHAPNNCKFGPDGNLYLTIGSNTGGGTPNTQTSDFGFRPEQPLSACMIKSNVRGSINGNCRPQQPAAELDRTGIGREEPIRCSVTIVAAGTRNSYSFTWRNNQLYATDNGLGGKGTFPILPKGWKPGQSCQGPVRGAELIASHDPGIRADLLHRITNVGGFHGHPNPSRRQCVYYGGNPTSGCDYPVPQLGGGTYCMETTKYPVGQQAQPGFIKPIYSFGKGRSVDGITTYTAGAFCGALRSSLLAVAYSSGDAVLWITLNGDGSAVSLVRTLPKSTASTGGQTLRNPLSIEQDPVTGNIFVAEFFGSRITVFRPVSVACSTRTLTPSHELNNVLGAGHATVGTKLVAMGGLRNGTASDDVFIYDLEEDKWTPSGRLTQRLTATASVGMERDLAVYGFGGFDVDGSATTLAFRLRTADDEQDLLPAMPVARGGATAAHLRDGSIAVAGGSAAGHVFNTVSIFDPVTSTWSEGPSMSHPRSHAASATVNGDMYVCGGFDGQNVLSSCERFDGVRWLEVASMSRPRKAFSAIAMDGERLFVKGGEDHEGNLLHEIDELNMEKGLWSTVGSLPVGRAHAVFGNFGQGVYAFGGATNFDVALHGDVIYHL